MSIFIFATLFCAALFFYFVWGAPYVPTWGERYKHLMEIVDVKLGEKVIDLGSGDGRLVIAFAKAGAEAHGYELNPLLVYRSRKAIQKAGLEDRAFIHWGSFWQVDLSSYNLVTVYALSHVYGRLEKKLDHELKPGSRVASIYFRLPTWHPISQKGSVYLYKKS